MNMESRPSAKRSFMNDCVGKDVGSESSLEVPQLLSAVGERQNADCEYRQLKVAYDDTTGIPLEQGEGNIS